MMSAPAVLIGLVFVLVSFSNLVLVHSIQCYGCHGEYCNDPFNRDRATVVNCSYNANLASRSASGDMSSKFFELDSLESKLFNLFFNKNVEYVCVKSAYYNGIHETNMTIRRCMPKSYKNVDACGQLTNIINAGYGTVRSCMSCDSNLCNAGATLTTSVSAFILICIVKSLI